MRPAGSPSIRTSNWTCESACVSGDQRTGRCAHIDIRTLAHVPPTSDNDLKRQHMNGERCEDGVRVSSHGDVCWEKLLSKRWGMRGRERKQRGSFYLDGMSERE